MLPLLRILRPQLPQRGQPRINKPQLLIRQRRINTPTARMPTHDNMLNLEMRDRVRDDRLAVQIRGRDDIRNVAVHKDVTGLQAQDRSFGDAAVRAADPEDLGGLALGEGGEEVGVFGVGFLRPLLVLAQQGGGEGVCGGGKGGEGLALGCVWVEGGFLGFLGERGRGRGEFCGI